MLTDSTYEAEVLAAEAAAEHIAVGHVAGYQPFAMLPATVMLRVIGDYKRMFQHADLTKDEAQDLLRQDIRKVTEKIRGMTGNMLHLGAPRHAVLLHAGLFIGPDALLGIKPLWEALLKERYNDAANALLLSEWGRLLGADAEDRQRLVELCDILREGKLPLHWYTEQPGLNS